MTPATAGRESRHSWPLNKDRSANSGDTVGVLVVGVLVEVRSTKTGAQTPVTPLHFGLDTWLGPKCSIGVCGNPFSGSSERLARLDFHVILAKCKRMIDHFWISGGSHIRVYRIHGCPSTCP